MSYDSTRSGNSNSNSKRSFNSFSSNNKNNSSNNDNKKKKTNQKTLGVAWGANSLSSSRSSFRSAPFSDFGSYMAVKNKKLHDQFDAKALNSNSSYNGSDSDKPLFKGVSIFVDGFTIPSSQELRAYMMKHGGRFENYFSRRRVTHIICSNLPDSKIKNLRSFSRGLPVVKPTWVLDCVAAGKMLSWVPYQLDQLTHEASNQPKLSDFFSLKCDSVSQGVSSDSTCMLKAEEAEGSEVRDDFLLDHACSDADELFECSRQSEEVMENADYEKIDTEDQIFGDGRLSLLETGKSVTSNDKVGTSPRQPSASTSSPDLSKKPSEDSLLGRGIPCHRHSTSEDPNFIENYFKSSRLHFIGTWRNRYRRRFASASIKNKQTNPVVNGSSTSPKATIIHMDMDCFFVAVVIRSRPDLVDKPVAVCHSDSSRGTAEISSANYPARDYGVKAGMFVRDAKARCPHLVIVPYNFEAYEEVADQFYNILHKHCDKVQAVSCDEAYLDVTDSDLTDPELLVSEIRKEILETTGCTASAGIASNMLMARLATRTAKPDGQCYIPPEKVEEYLLQLSIKSLPGIGHVLEQKLKKKGLQTCGQLRMLSKEALQRDFGTKTGEMLWNYSRGIDNRLVGVLQESKSIGAEVNWGVRFKDIKDSEHFLLSLCKEVSLRLQGCGLQGRTFTLKIKKRRKNVGEPTKYLGCGDCENFSHSTTVPVATHDVGILQRISAQLFGSFHIDVQDIRGIGLQVTKLESDETVKQGHERNSLRSWLASGKACSSEQSNMCDKGQSHLEPVESSAMISNPSCHEPLLNPVSALPSFDDLDMDVIGSLPPELVSEINDMYGGRLTDLVAKSKGKGEEKGRAKASAHSVKVSVEEAEGEAHTSEGAINDNIREKDKELPDELRADIVKAFPTHRRPNCLLSSCNTSGEVQAVTLTPAVKNTESIECTEDDNLWMGNPPPWVHKFKVSRCLMLNILAEMFLRSGSTWLFSSTLQCCLSALPMIDDASDDVTSEALYSMCELLKQYIRLKLETDIEEIYLCFRLLKRLTLKSKDFKDAYDTVLPYLQASVRESYGGQLNLPAM